MAIRFSCGSCGCKLKVGDEHTGRRSKCPKCGGEIEVPAVAAREQEDAPAPEPPPIPVAVVPDPADRPRWRTRLAKAAGIVGLIAITAIGAEGYARLRMGHHAISTPTTAAAPPTIAKTEPEPPPKPAAEARPATNFDPAAIEQLAQIYPERTARAVFGKGAGIKGIEVGPSEVKRVEPDRCQIDWLWRGEVTFTLTQEDGSTIPVLLEMVYHLSPNGEEWECWREVTTPPDGRFTRHVHFKSPWKDWFEDRVYREYMDWLESGEPHDRYDYEKLFEALAAKHDISFEEIVDIARPGKARWIDMRRYIDKPAWHNQQPTPLDIGEDPGNTSAPPIPKG